MTFSGVGLFPIHDRIGSVFAALAACCGQWFPIRIYFWLCEEIHSTSSAVTVLWLFIIIDPGQFWKFSLGRKGELSAQSVIYNQ